MVHVRKCPCQYGRGKPETDFYIDGKPQIYCMGWIDRMTDEPLEVCRDCEDYIYGEQAIIDFEKAKERENGSDE